MDKKINYKWKINKLMSNKKINKGEINKYGINKYLYK